MTETRSFQVHPSPPLYLEQCGAYPHMSHRRAEWCLWLGGYGPGARFALMCHECWLALDPDERRHWQEIEP